MPRIVESRTCTACGIEQHFIDEPKPDARCSDCGASLRPPDPPPPDAIQWSGASAIEAGAAEVRALVEEMKRRR